MRNVALKIALGVDTLNKYAIAQQLQLIATSCMKQKEKYVDKMYKSEPKIAKDNYRLIHALSNWNGGAVDIYTPFIICLNAEGNLVPATEVIGGGKSSCRMV